MLLSPDLIAFTLSFALLALYEIYIRWRTARHDPHYTVQAINAEARRLWVNSVIEDRRDILAVQTVRNSTMAAIFLASTAVLLIMGVISLAEHGRDVNLALHALNIVGTVDPSLWLIKLLILVVDLCVAFFAFTQAVRNFNHVGYLLNVPAALKHPIITPRYVTNFLNRAAHFYSIGMRTFYFTFPLLLWLFGPQFLGAASLLLVLILYRLDRATDAGD